MTHDSHLEAPPQEVGAVEALDRVGGVDRAGEDDGAVAERAAVGCLQRRRRSKAKWKGWRRWQGQTWRGGMRARRKSQGAWRLPKSRNTARVLYGFYLGSKRMALYTAPQYKCSNS
eukprot:2767165-Pleurochrysis_carterae.AAC.2